MSTLGCLMSLSKRLCSNWLHDPPLLLSTIPLSLPYCSQWYHYSPTTSESFLSSLFYTLHPSSPSTNSASTSLKIYPESDYLLTTSISTTQVQAIIIPHLNCHHSLLLSTLCHLWPVFYTAARVLFQSCVFLYNTENKTRVHTKTMHDQTPSFPQASSPSTLPLAHCTLATVAFLIFLHHVKMFLPRGPLGLVFPLPRPLFPQCFLISFKSLLKCSFLRQFLPGHLI